MTDTTEPNEVGPQYAGFCERLAFQLMGNALRSNAPGPIVNGGNLTEEEMRRSVAYARRHGLLLTLGARCEITVDGKPRRPPAQPSQARMLRRRNSEPTE